MFLPFSYSIVLLKVISIVYTVNTFGDQTNEFINPTDLLRSLLCGYQPIQEIPGVHLPLCQAVPWQASFGGATPHLRHL